MDTYGYPYTDISFLVINQSNVANVSNTDHVSGVQLSPEARKGDAQTTALVVQHLLHQCSGAREASLCVQHACLPCPFSKVL